MFYYCNMDNSSNKNSQSRNNINDRMQSFFQPNSIKPQNMQDINSHGLDNEYYNYKPEPSQQRQEVLQKSDLTIKVAEPKGINPNLIFDYVGKKITKELKMDDTLTIDCVQ